MVVRAVHLFFGFMVGTILGAGITCFGSYSPRVLFMGVGITSFCGFMFLLTPSLTTHKDEVIFDLTRLTNPVEWLPSLMRRVLR